MPFTPQTKTWPSDRALMLVHGVGNYGPGDYDRLKQAIQSALGDDAWNAHAVYEMFWDPISDWFAEKLQAKDVVARLLAQLKQFFDASQAGAWAAEGVGDIIWPVMLRDAREALRNACVRQIQQMVKDGRDAGIKRPDMKLSVMCHSLGCFHVYEALSAAARDEDLQLNTSTTGIQFTSVVMFASPVQLIRAVASGLGKFVPNPGGLYCLKSPSLVAPGYSRRDGQYVNYARRILSVTGNLDPVGGYLWRSQLGWAYMKIPGIDYLVEPQNIVGLDSETDLATLIENALGSNQSWAVQPNNPHDWVHYVQNNADRLRQWMLG